MVLNYTDWSFLSVYFWTEWGFTCLCGLALALATLISIGVLMRAGLDFVTFGAFEIFRLGVGGGISPGQLLRTWTSLTLWPLSSGG